MRTRKIKRLAYNYLVKDGHTHQETFDELKKIEKIDLDVLAVETSKIPSINNHEEMKSYRMLFIICLVFVGSLRLLGFYAIIQFNDVNMPLILLGLLFSLLVPILGILGSLKRRIEMYSTISFLLGLGIFRSFSKGELNLNATSLVVLLPSVGGIILALILINKLKTSYTKELKELMINEKLEKTWVYTFEKETISNENLLDTDFN